jgi:hypothetical protein
METLRQLVRSSDVAGASSELSAAAALDSAADFSDARATVSGLRQPLLAKDARESRKCRADGNESLASNELMKSRAFLTSACMYAPSNSDELAKALANRAEVSLRLASDAQGTGEHAPFARAALRDSNRAVGITRSEARVKRKRCTVEAVRNTFLVSTLLRKRTSPPFPLAIFILLCLRQKRNTDPRNTVPFVRTSILAINPRKANAFAHTQPQLRASSCSLNSRSWGA